MMQQLGQAREGNVKGFSVCNNGEYCSFGSISLKELFSGRFLENLNGDFDYSFTQEALLETLKYEYDGYHGQSSRSWRQSYLDEYYKKFFAQVKELGWMLMEYGDLGGNKALWDPIRLKYTQFVRM